MPVGRGDVDAGVQAAPALAERRGEGAVDRPDQAAGAAPDRARRAPRRGVADPACARSIAARSSSASTRGCRTLARTPAAVALRAQLALRGGQAVARGGDVVAAAQDRLGRRLLAALELGEQALGLLRAGLEHLHTRDDLAVLVGDPLQELGALQQVREAVGLEDHRESVGLVGLVELDEPVGQRGAAGFQLGAGAREAVACDLEVVTHREQLVAGAVQLGLNAGQPALGPADLALEAADAVVVALDVLGQHALLALLALDLGALLSMRLGQRRALPGKGQQNVGRNGHQEW